MKPLHWNCQQMSIIHEEYLEEKERNQGQRISMTVLERRHGLKPNQLRNWRANHVLRKPKTP